MTCGICTYAEDYGSWPLSHRGTHCDGCHRSWTGARESHCMGTTSTGDSCHAHFSADSVADKHRKGDHCMTRNEMLSARDKKGLLIFRECETSKGMLWRNADTLKLRPVWTA